MNIINITQNTSEWLQWRQTGISASDIPTAMGLNPYKTAYRLWLEKTGRANPEDLSGNPNVQRGNRLEPLARDHCENRDEEILLPVCGEYTPWPNLKASFDGLSSQGRPYEFKAPTENRFMSLIEQGTASDTYQLYAWQVKAQCVVAESADGVLFFYMEDGRNCEFVIELSPQDRIEILAAAKDFWHCVETDTPPPLDPERDVYIPKSGEDEFRWQAYADLYVENQAQIDVLDKQLEPLKKAQGELKNTLVAMMGDFQTTDYGGIKVTRFSRQGSIDYSKFIKSKGIDKADLEAFRKKETWQSRVTVSKGEMLVEEVIGNEAVPTTTSGFF